MKKQSNLFYYFMVALLAAGLSVNSGCKKKRTIEQLVDAEFLTEAIEQVEELEGEIKLKGYSKIATYYFQNNKYEKAADFFTRAGAHERVVNCFYLGSMISRAEAYTEKLTGSDKQMCAAHLGKRFYAKGDYERAIKYYRLGGDAGKVTYIETRVPIFKLAEKIDEAAKKIKDYNVIYHMKAFSTTLKEYIYLDKYQEWRFGQKTKPDYRAAKVLQKTFETIEKEAAPYFFEKVRELLIKGDWTKKSVESIDFYHSKLMILVQMIEDIHRIAEMRSFFARHSVIFREPATRRDTAKANKTQNTVNNNKSSEQQPESITFTDPGNAYNYEQVYLRALDYADSIFDTIRGAADVKRLDWLKDYTDDLSVDSRNIKYIHSMLQNLQTRMSNILRFSKQLKRSTEADAIKNKAKILSRDFMKKASYILHHIATGQYDAANQLLTTSYESFRQQLAIRKEKN